MMGVCSSNRRSIINSEHSSLTINITFNGRRLVLEDNQNQINPDNAAKEISGVWEVVKSTGQIPCERSGHAVAVQQGKAFLFGGYGGTNPSHLSDFYSFDFDTQKWKVINSTNGPCPRTAFAMCVTPESFVYLWGGTDHDLQGLEDQELYEYDIYNSKWRVVETLNKGILDLRYFGRSASYHDKKIYYFGGGVKGGRFTNELIVLDLHRIRWERVETTGDIPCPRYKHQACVVENKLYVIGGGCYLPPEEILDVYCLCLKTWVWSKIETLGTTPEGRAAHACEYDPITHSIYMWGGFNQSLVPLFDFYKLDLNTFEWSNPAILATVEENSTWPGRSFHASCFHGGALYSFNGSDGESRYSDLMKFQIHHSPARLTDYAIMALRSSEQQGLTDIVTDPKVLPSELRKEFRDLKGLKRSPNHTQRVPYS
mmetsp:Transcript_3878/g.5397  ORF Transcript_3878/g.5397 Transcript_3878/m.5397 type:complete len:427 (-) Transcript_3878:345-1625(-)